jgi:hypothetical protein
MTTDSEQLFQYATVKITCNDEIGTAVLYSPGESLDYMYILTAKHCLTGKDFDKQYVNTDIIIEKIFNPSTGEYHSCQIMETDMVICTDSDKLDLALIIIPKVRVESLSGIQYFFQVIDKPGVAGECMIRGFADFNSGEEDRSYNLKFVESLKDKPKLFTLNFDGTLDTRYQSALENVQGLSGSGVFAVINETVFLFGLVHTYEEKNRFFATQITTFNYLIPLNYEHFIAVEQEENQSIITTFKLIDINKNSIIAKTRDTIGDIHIVRDISDAKKMLENSRMLVLHGKAGTGKSALAKGLILDLEKSTDNSVITFNSEQLFSPTLNGALIKAGFSATVNELIESPLSKKKTIFWIESFEKLVEAGFEGAFTELLLLVKNNPRLSLLVTIRDYFLQKFKIFYHSELLSWEIFFYVDEFNDDEMKQIRAQIPQMEPLFNNPKLIHLLKTPYYLDKAFRIFPQLLEVENLDDTQFKKLMWEEIVEAGQRERGATFAKIALQRAKSMELYTSYEADAVTDALVSDTILQVEQGELSNRFSPAHDILEDWALIRYIKQQKQDAESSHAFIENLDNSPAVRRAFRLWLEEFYLQDPGEADNFSSEVLLSPVIKQSWKDELFVYILRSKDAYSIFYSLKKQLLESNGVVLLRIIHLLRTCCKELKNTTSDFNNLVPSGSGWDALIDFIQENKHLIGNIPDIESLMLDVIFDWSRQLPDFNPLTLPSSARSAALILLDYTLKNQSSFKDYRRNFNLPGPLSLSLRLLLKLTSVVKEDVKKLLDAVMALPSLNDDLWNDKNVLVYTKNFIVDGVYGEQVCKYFPDEVLSMASNEWLEKPKIYPARRILSLIEQGEAANYWGLEEGSHYEAPSAFQTFFYWMFLYHPDKAIDYVCDFLNTAFEKNKKNIIRHNGQRQDVKLDFAQDGERVYYGCYDYWELYRGHSTINKIIQSLLMALEKGLLDLAEEGTGKHAKLKKLLRDLTLNSNNVGVLAVISSVIQAHPYLLDETTAVLLGSRTIFEWDSTRYTRDMLHPDYYGTNVFLSSERFRSNRLKHRLDYFRGLIGFVADYMFIHQTMNPQLFKQIDAMWALVPEADFLWRKALSEMDVRKYKFEPVTISGYENYIALSPGYDKDVAEVINSYEGEKMPAVGTVWASNVFDRKLVDDNSYSAWKRGYEDLQNSNFEFSFMTAPGKMATVGLRDYFDQLEYEEKIWCRDELLKRGSAQLIIESGYSRGMDDDFLDKNAILYGVPLLFKLDTEFINEVELRSLIFRLIIAAIDSDTKQYLLLSIVENVLEIRPQFSKNCWHGLLKFIQYNIDENRKKEKGRLLGDYMYDHEGTERAKSEFGETLLKDVILDAKFDGNTEFYLDNTTCWLFDNALRMIAVGTQQDVQKIFIANMLTMHKNYLGSLSEYDQSEFSQSREVFKSFYAKYLLSRSNPEAIKLFTDLLDTTLQNNIELNTYEIIEFIKSIIKQTVLELNSWPSRTQPIEKFWQLWNVFKDWISTTKRAYLIPVLLLDVGWDDSVMQWNVLEKKSSFYKDFILEYGNNAVNECIDLVSGIGFKPFMPQSVSWMAQVIKYQTIHIVKISKLDRFVHRTFFNYGTQIKGNKRLAKDFVFILDFLIDKGSPKAYMLKEEMIQYK